MDERKQFWIDFAEGRLSVPDMLAQTEIMPELLDWLSGIADPKFKTYTIGDNPFSPYTPVEHPFDAKLQIEIEVQKGHGGSLGRYLNIHSYFSKVLTTAFPNERIAVDQTLNEKFCFLLDACPEYIGGPEADQLLDELLEDIPPELSKTKRVKLYKEKVKATFHVAGNRFPRWVQDAEWPISPSGKPMRFVEQKRKKAYDAAMYMHFIFEDVDTGEIRIIDQFT